jgi:hypothetical protein
VNWIETIKFVGGVSGIASALFLVYDRLIRGRPLVYLCPQEFRVHVRINNAVSETIIVDDIEIEPPVLEIVWGTDTRSDVEAAAALIGMFKREEKRTFVIIPTEERSLPLIFKLGDLEDNAPIKIKLYWRNTRRSLPYRRTISVRTCPRDLRLLFEAARSQAT